MGHTDAFKGSANVPGALSGPHHVSERHGGVIESSDADTAVERGGKKGIARAKTGAKDSKLFVALLLQPIDAATNVDYRLTAGSDGAPQVGADRIIGARQLCRTADIVVGLAEAQGGNAKAVKNGAESIVAEGVSIPLRHDNDRLFRLACHLFSRRGEPAGID